jgi:hypothetical protein
MSAAGTSSSISSAAAAAAAADRALQSAHPWPSQQAYKHSSSSTDSRTASSIRRSKTAAGGFLLEPEGTAALAAAGLVAGSEAESEEGLLLLTSKACLLSQPPPVDHLSRRPSPSSTTPTTKTVGCSSSSAPGSPSCSSFAWKDAEQQPPLGAMTPLQDHVSKKKLQHHLGRRREMNAPMHGEGVSRGSAAAARRRPSSQLVLCSSSPTTSSRGGRRQEADRLPTPGVTPPSRMKAPDMWGGEAFPSGGGDPISHAKAGPPRRRTSSAERFSLGLHALLSSVLVDDAIKALELVHVALQEEKDRMDTSNWRVSFERTVRIKRGASPRLFAAPAVSGKIVDVMSTHFWSDATATLPAGLLREALTWLPLQMRGDVCSVSKRWKCAAEHDFLWEAPYMARFTFHNPSPETPAGLSFKGHYRYRVSNPQVGDRVQVAWRGKFRLESLDVFNGLAWWLAEVVERHPDGSQYKVAYPGWDHRWDEWVPRDRLRWGNTIKATRLIGYRVEVGDDVEVWCGGINVPGAWLEAEVKQMKGGRLYLGSTITGGHFWVETSRCRLVRKGRRARTSSLVIAAAQASQSCSSAASCTVM